MGLSALLLSRMEIAFTFAFNFIFPDFPIRSAAKAIAIEALQFAAGRSARRIIFESRVRTLDMVVKTDVHYSQRRRTRSHERTNGAQTKMQPSSPLVLAPHLQRNDRQKSTKDYLAIQIECEQYLTVWRARFTRTPYWREDQMISTFRRTYCITNARDGAA
jgi:hypothetical protein